MSTAQSITKHFADIPEEVLLELPDLTIGQQTFVNALLSNAGITLSDAFRKAYDTSGWVETSIWTQATRLRKHPKVILWLDTAKALQLKQSVVTLDSHIQDLEGLAARAEAAGNYGAAVNAKTNQGKASGLYKERIEMSTDPKSAIREGTDLIISWSEAQGIETERSDVTLWLMSEFGLSE